MDIIIHAIHFDADSKLEAFIEQKLSKLTTFYDRITSAEVFLRLENEKATVREKVVEVKLSIPGTVLFAKETTKSFEVSTDQVVEHLRRQLVKHVEKMRAK